MVLLSNVLPAIVLSPDLRTNFLIPVLATNKLQASGVSSGFFSSTTTYSVESSTTHTELDTRLWSSPPYHYRIIVAEVCLPSTDIQSGEQLLQVILNCLIGHQDAFVKCGMLHRDISTGNILIRPTVICINPKTGESAVVCQWYGLSCDWELAKALPKDDAKPKARQPHRTGTWHYMSVYSLTYPFLPLSLADELEPFLHVMIYLAVRFLRTSALDVNDFVKSYFEGYETQDNQLTCSLLKRMVVRNGSLKWNNRPIHFVSGGPVLPLDQSKQPQTDAEYLSPLNDVIVTFLAYLEARYAILDYEGSAATKVPKPLPSLQSEIEAATSSAARKRQIKLAGCLKMGIPDFSNSNVYKVPTPGAKGCTRPPESVYDLAAMLKTHEAVIRLLAEASDATRVWPSGDYAGDQLKGYVPPDLQSTKNRICLQMRSTLVSIPEGQELAVRAHTAA